MQSTMMKAQLGSTTPRASVARGATCAMLPTRKAPATLKQAVRKTTLKARGGKCGPVRETVTMMPIGVPRVPYRTPGENSWQWVDIWNCLYRERIIFLGQQIDEELGNQLVGTMLYLDSIDGQKDMYLYINSMGGDVVPTLAIYDTMSFCKSDVGTVGFGGAMAMGGFLLACGAKGKRAVLPNTKIMIHQPSGAARGQAADIYNEARELLRLRTYMSTVLAQAVDKPMERVKEEFKRDFYFSPKEAVEYGVIDRIIYPRKLKSLGL
uniref:ATP-dependent Clp protease proteolytic subunit n=1 Tax=Pyramimonas obovata TaxID=1411642 RepID=A0A7S0WT76_9CHLO|mmetsp:Transcript_38675/g.84122  ORF Transcript_38675/g.84122 Transcript_38675/m.84122 type:complete len:266 (+) Transcript_38675:125-922(+)